jgi:hypothetical protein
MASYPSNVKSFTTKVDGVTTVAAADINDVQSEIVAVETALGTNPATSVLGSGSIGSYTAAPGTLTNVSARLQNIEAGLSASSTDGSRIGYTQLATGSVGTSTSITVAGASYVKLVVVINITTIGSGTAITMGANSATSSKYGHFSFAATPAGLGSAAGSGGIPVSSAQVPASGDTITVEFYNVAGAGVKPVSFINAYGWGTGALISGGTVTSAITTITITCSTAPTTSTYTVYGVK